MPRRSRKLLTIGHSYCIALNRRLAHEMARQGGNDWEVTAAAPAHVYGELPTAREESEACNLALIPALRARKTQLLLYGRKLRELMHDDWELIHCWEEPHTLATAQILHWTPPSAPFVFWTMQNISKSYFWPFSASERYCLERCSGWLASGYSIVETMLPRGYGRRPYRIMPIGVDVEVFRPDRAAGAFVRNQLGWKIEGPPVVGYLGRLVEEKGLMFMTRILDQLRTPWRALMVGAGPLETRLRLWSTRYGDRVQIVTGVRHHQVPAYLNAMDLLCAPSQTRPNWREQFGRMIIEGFAVGLPILASDSGEIPYVVNGAGVIVSESDAAGWTEALGDLLENPTQRREFAERGLQRAHSAYTWPTIARNHLAFFTELMETQTRRIN